MANTDNPTVWQTAEEAVLNAQRPYVPNQGQDLSSTLILNAAEQAIAFAEAHIGQVKGLIAQFRSVNGR